MGKGDEILRVRVCRFILYKTWRPYLPITSCRHQIAYLNALVMCHSTAVAFLIEMLVNAIAKAVRP